MPRKTQPPLPSVARAIATVGEHLRLARLRRGFTVTSLAERAGMSRPTLRAVERGDPHVSLAALANVLHALGLQADLLLLAREDVLGRQLQDAALGRPRRTSRQAPGSRHGG